MNTNKSILNTAVLMIFAMIPAVNFGQPAGNDLTQFGYLFSQSVPGRVLQKSGLVTNAVLNYDTNEQAIIFERAGKPMVLTGLEAIDTIFIQERKFIPGGNLIYELLAGKPSVGLYLTYTNKWIPVEATTDHTGTSGKPSSQVSNTVSNVYLGRPFKKDHSLQIVRHYWIRKSGNFHKVPNEKTVLKVFSDQLPAVKNYISEQNISVHNEADLVKLITFNNTLQ